MCSLMCCGPYTYMTSWDSNSIQFNSILFGKFSIYTPLADINFNSEQIWQKKQKQKKHTNNILTNIKIRQIALSFYIYDITCILFIYIAVMDIYIYSGDDTIIVNNTFSVVSSIYIYMKYEVYMCTYAFVPNISMTLSNVHLCHL